MHVLDAQSGVVFAGDGQTLPQVLQLVGSNEVLVQSPPHCVVPPVQTSVHLPATHD